ncbi:MAG: TIGR00159 family protein [Ruminococcaceae bacterium]|nr:TIGR00159 family protein [Oscillospiraceae bacterium]
MFEYIMQNLAMIRIRDIIDIAVVAFLIYKGVKLVRETRAVQIITGICVLIVATQLSGWFKLNAINFILVNTMEVGLVALLVVFQPELRKALEKVGRSTFKRILVPQDTNYDSAIIEIVQAVSNLRSTKTGALIIIERQTKLGDIIKTGVALNSEITSELLVNIFVPNTPLHDGAVIIGENKIKAAACFLPLTQATNISQELGTRHRAAIGVTEIADCLSIVVSEETGRVSVCQDGMLHRNISLTDLETKLKDVLITPENEIKNPKDLLKDLVVRKK